METFYQRKDFACVNQLLSFFDQQSKSNLGFSLSLTGFMAEIFAQYPDKISTILATPYTYKTTAILHTALFLADLKVQALAYAQTHALLGQHRAFVKQHLKPIRYLKIGGYPNKYDMLLGAFFASGDTQHIQHLLTALLNRSETMLHDGIRLGLMHRQFGLHFQVPGRQVSIAKNLCAKYHCQTDHKAFMQVSNIGSATFALLALSNKHEKVNASMQNFMHKHAEVQRAYLVERNELANYMTSLVVYGVIKDHPENAAPGALKHNELALQAFETFTYPEYDKIFKKSSKPLPANS